ncbi:MAG: LamG domain-containing protein [bacterium]
MNISLPKFLIVFTLILLSTKFSNAQNVALNFDGIDDYVSTSIPPIAGNTAKTIEAWVKTTANCDPNNGGLQNVIVDMGTQATGLRFTLNILFSNAIRVEVQGNGISGTTPINDGLWHHVAAVYDPLAMTKVTLYLDGVVEATGNFTVTVNTSSTGNIQLGRRVDGIHHFNGSMDEVRVWNVARTQAQITNNMNAILCNPTTNLIAYFPFFEGTAGINNVANNQINSFGNSFGDVTLNNFSLTGAISNYVAGKVLTAGMTYTKTNLTRCNTYTWPLNNQTYTTSGNYLAKTIKSNGCDSIVKLNLTITNILRSNVNINACDTFLWSQNGNIYTNSGTYSDTVISSLGCDSIVTLNLTINTIPPTIQNVSACDSYTWSENNQTYTQSTQAFINLKNSRGCDSLLILNLTINKKDSSSLNVNQCNPYTWSLTGLTYTQSGIYKRTILTSNGCDSVVTLYLQISPAYRNIINEVACKSFTWDKNGKTYTSSTMDSVVYKTAADCDSILVLDIYIVSFDVSVSNKTTYLEANLSDAQYQWFNCITQLPIVGATSQAFSPNSTGSYKCIITYLGCVDTSSCVTYVKTVGLNNTLNHNINIYPNPAQDFIYIEGLSENINQEVLVFDVHGSIVIK